jgi:hypothetical protein
LSLCRLPLLDENSAGIRQVPFALPLIRKATSFTDWGTSESDTKTTLKRDLTINQVPEFKLNRLSFVEWYQSL